MADDDEVDVLGDFNLENLLTKDENRLNSCYDSGVSSELLHSDYNSTWYLDVGSPACWYDRTQIDSFPSLPFSLSLGSSPGPSQWGESSNATSTNNGIAAGSFWTDKERNLLKEGLELFGRSWSRLAQFVGTKTSHQIKNYVKMSKIGNDVETVPIVVDNTNTQFSCGDGSTEIANIPYTELIDDMQIPASMEEVIAVVSTAQPTVSPSGGSNRGEPSTVQRKRKMLTHVDRSMAKRGRRPRTISHKGSVPVSQKRGRGRPKKSSEKSYASGAPSETVIQSSTGEEASLPQLHGEVVRIRREGSAESDDSDVEIDIEDGDSEENGSKGLQDHGDMPKKIDSEPSQITENDFKYESMEIFENTVRTKIDDNRNVKQERPDCDDKTCVTHDAEGLYGYVDSAACFESTMSKEGMKPCTSHQEFLDMIHEMPPPSCERFLERDKISDEERAIHADFFEGRPAKNEMRYLKIRNHIIDMWKQNRPTYVTKTSVRTGLRNCGDVNCIGRIHTYLEQIGAINFGCDQTRYSKPADTPAGIPHRITPINTKDKQSRELLCMESMRPRKKKFDHIEEDLLASAEGGYTIKHTEDGKTVLTYNTVVKLKPSKIDHTPVKLLRCVKFSEDNPAPYKVNLSLEALLVVDIHAHCSKESEVMGLLGGVFKSGTLQIQCAVPCRASYSSNTHCDMCPVSQSEAVDAVSREGMHVVGWYHSHPSFLPNPSQQDLFTQTSMQRWLTEKSGAPFVGLILSPYGPNSTSLASIYRVIIVDAESNTPFRFPVEVGYSKSDAKQCLQKVSVAVAAMEKPSLEGQFSGQDHKSSPISLQNKFLESALHHIRSCEPCLSIDLQRAILKGLHEISSVCR